MIDRVMTHQEVLKLLQDLGKFKFQIVASLLLQGCKGTKRSRKDCPIARYLKHNKAGLHVSVFGDNYDLRIGVSLVDGAYEEKYEYSFRDHPELYPIYDFINSFDEDMYPQLESS
jgi:hypothetical protein